MAPQSYNQLPQSEVDARLAPVEENKCIQCAKQAQKEKIIDLMILLNIGLFLLSVVAISFVLVTSSTGKYVLSRNADFSLPDSVYCESLL